MRFLIRRFKIICYVLICLLFVWVISWRLVQYRSDLSVVLKSKQQATKSDEERLQAQNEFWERYFSVLEANQLNFGDTLIQDIVQYIPKEEQVEGENTKDSLNSKCRIQDASLEELKNKHRSILRELPYEKLKTTYIAGTTGVALVGGGKFSWLSYLSILSLRQSGSKLPVEVLMPKTEDYERERDFCDLHLAKLDAKCVVLPQKLGPSVVGAWNDKIKSYQFKVLTIMASSFQNVVLIDSDNMLLKDPDHVVESKLFTEFGMIAWPDYWKRTVSPKFYEIADVEVHDKKRVRYNRLPLLKAEENISPEVVPFHDLEGTIPELSTEAGQLIINKATHPKTILLSAYYNLNGPNLYYKLFSLGEQGEGDKDTFVAAATVASEKYYQVKSYIKSVGYFDYSDTFKGIAMGQKDPIHDNQLFEDKMREFKDEHSSKDPEEQISQLQETLKSFDSNNEVPVFALHCNFPKLDPLELMKKEEIYDLLQHQLKLRTYGGFEYHDSATGRLIDFELQQWKNIHDTLCVQHLHFVHFDNANLDIICLFAENQVERLST